MFSSSVIVTITDFLIKVSDRGKSKQCMLCYAINIPDILKEKHNVEFSFV